jgi:hypothetical protein
LLRAAASARPAHRHLVVCAVTALTLLVLAAPAVAKPPTVFNPIVEAQNFSITQQRQAIYDIPQYQTQLAARQCHQHRQRPGRPGG